MKNSYDSGLFAELVARMYLRLHGYGILEKRYVTGQRTGRAEVDIIAQKSDMIVFVEVKSRPTAELGLDAVTYGQKVRLRRAADNYLRRKRWMGNARFDVIVVLPRLKIRWFKRVF
jgi:putative endonuclease